MKNVLEKILAHKREEVKRLSRERSLASLQAAVKHAPPARGFEQALRARVELERPAVIAEIKRASPSQGLIRVDFDPVKIATSYERAGAACVSVLTDEYFFEGSVADLRAVRETSSLPLLRKDFILDPWQVYETRLMGADCLLLIAAALPDSRLGELCDLAYEIGLDVLLEVHEKNELERAIETSAALIGINNRNLDTFETSLETAITLAPSVPGERIVISESGIGDSADVKRLRRAGINAFLVGEVLMRARDPGARLKTLFGTWA